MRAFVSGQSGIALLNEGSDWYVLRDAGGSPVKGRFSSAVRLLDGSTDIEEIPNADAEDLGARLASARAKDTALQYVLILIEEPEIGELEQRILARLKDLLFFPGVPEFVLDRLYAAPIGSSSEVRIKALMAEDREHPVCAIFKQVLRDQASIGRVRSAWESISAGRFRSVDEMDEFFFSAVRRGLVRGLVQDPESVVSVRVPFETVGTGQIVRAWAEAAGARSAEVGGRPPGANRRPNRDLVRTENTESGAPTRPRPEVAVSEHSEIVPERLAGFSSSDVRHPGEVTLLLNSAASGEPEKCQKLADLVYAELRRIAARAMHSEPSDHTLQATLLAHDVYLKLRERPDRSWQSRAHFFATAAKAMRQMLVDHGRKRRSLRRGGVGQRVNLDEAGNASAANFEDLLAVDQALTRLEAQDKRQLQIVELRYFAGLTDEEIAAVLNISTRTVKREWTFARLWLHAELTRSGRNPSPIIVREYATVIRNLKSEFAASEPDPARAVEELRAPDIAGARPRRSSIRRRT
jgi:RNA polymerase sigma-70 factor (ECF subfamily)